MSLTGVIIGICGMVGCNDNITAIIVFGTIEIFSIGIFCITEGKVDAESVKNVANVVETLVDMIIDLRNGKDVVVPEDKPSDSLVHDDPVALNESTDQTEK